MAGWNGSGVFSKTYSWVQDQLNGIKIRADRHDVNDTDFTNGINNCLTKDGQNSATANLPMGGFKHTAIAKATALNQYASAEQIIDNELTYYTASGTDTYVITPSPAITVYAAGQSWKVKFTNANTGAATININSLGAKDLKKSASTALASGDIVAGTIKEIIYDGTNFQVKDVVVADTGITQLTGAVTAGPGSGSQVASLGSFTSAALLAALTDETGTGVAVFGTSPTITTPVLNQPNIVGTTTNDSAAAGSVGQIIESNVASGSAVSLVNSTGKTITSISLTAGDWDVWGNVGVIQAASTTLSFMEAAIGPTDNTVPAAPNGGAFMTLSLTFATGATSQVFPVGMTRISVASTTTYYLVVRAAFAASTATAYGYIGARRVR